MWAWSPAACPGPGPAGQQALPHLWHSRAESLSDMDRETGAREAMQEKEASCVPGRLKGPSPGPRLQPQVWRRASLQGSRRSKGEADKSPA